MTVSRSGEDWTIKVEETTILWKIRSESGYVTFDHRALSVFEQFLRTQDVSSYVTIIQLEDPVTEEIFKTCEKSAEAADESGVDRWAIVAEGIKDVPLTEKIDTGRLTVLKSENREKALEWAE